MYPDVKNVDVNDLIPGCSNFRWREALYLPSWKIYCYPTELEAQKIISFTSRVVQPLRNRIGKPFNIHCWLRPEIYNAFIKGSKESWHKTGGAIDFNVVTMSCDEVRDFLRPRLAEYGIRMEESGDERDDAWVHVDDKPVKAGEPMIFKIPLAKDKL